MAVLAWVRVRKVDRSRSSHSRVAKNDWVMTLVWALNYIRWDLSTGSVPGNPSLPSTTRARVCPRDVPAYLGGGSRLLPPEGWLPRLAPRRLDGCWPG